MQIDQSKELTAKAPDSVDSCGIGGGLRGDRGEAADDGNTRQGRGVGGGGEIWR
jgi:hypothetical protein